jgi:hypothetical protein
VYLIAEADGVVDGTGVSVQRGRVYVTGGDWFHQSLTESQRLAPGTYQVVVEVFGKWGAESFTESLTVPDEAAR